jgi:hypothetical protein
VIQLDTADGPLALLMKRCGASFADAQPDGTYILHAYPTKERVRYLVSRKMLEGAKEFLETKVPPLRGEIDPKPLDVAEKRPRYSSGKRMSK